MELAFEESGGNFVTNDAINLDLLQLCECVLILSKMDKLTDSKSDFERDRKVDCDYLVPTTLDLNGQLSLVKVMLENVTGFFIIDRLISRKLPTLRSSHEVDLLWDFFNQRISSASDQMENETDFEVLRSLKEQFVVFVYAMKSFAFATDLIEALIMRLSDVRGVLLTTSECPFLEVLNNDDYRPMQFKC